jgi:hypothetical protein
MRLLVGSIVAAAVHGEVSAAKMPCSNMDMMKYSEASTKYEKCISTNPIDMEKLDFSGFCRCAGDYVARLSELPLGCTTAHTTKEETIQTTASFCSKGSPLSVGGETKPDAPAADGNPVPTALPGMPKPEPAPPAAGASPVAKRPRPIKGFYGKPPADFKLDDLRQASKQLKVGGAEFEELAPEDIEATLKLLKDKFAEAKGSASAARDTVGVMSDMLDKDLMGKARAKLTDKAKREHFEKTVSAAAKATREEIAKDNLMGKLAGHEENLEDGALKILIRKEGRWNLGEKHFRAHDANAAGANFKLPKGFGGKLPMIGAENPGVMVWENPTPWAEDGKKVKSSVSGLSLFDDAGQRLRVKDLAAGEAIEITFPISDPTAKCMWWDDSGFGWKTDGVETVWRAADTLCKTTHLTEFALVEDVAAAGTASTRAPVPTDQWTEADEDVPAQSAGSFAGNGGSYGSQVGSGSGGSQVGSGSGGFAAAPPEGVDRAKNGHGAPSCMSKCYLHYAYKTALPRGTQPKCDFWTDYLFGAECKSAALQPTCAGDGTMKTVIMKCIDSGCDPRQCKGKENTAEMDLRLRPPLGSQGCNAIHYIAQAQQCRSYETMCAEGLKAVPRSIGTLRGLFCGATPQRGSCAQFGDCIKNALLSSRCGSDQLGNGYNKFASTQTAVCTDKPAPVPCVDDRKNNFVNGLLAAGKLASSNSAWTSAQTCDYYRDYVFGKNAGGVVSKH